jgi:hypothetical protein
MGDNRFKDFGAGVGKASKLPLSFKLHGEDFECVPAIQGRVMLQLIKTSNGDDGAATAGVIDGFFGHVLKDESKVRFDALLEDKEKIVTVETLSEIVAWLIEEYSDRPESQPEA